MTPLPPPAGTVLIAGSMTEVYTADQVRAVERAALASRSPAQAPEPLTTKDVLAAIYAVDREAARRGEMFPQTRDEQREDSVAVSRVMGMIEWYERNTGCARIKDWPHRATAQAPEQPVYLTPTLRQEAEPAGDGSGSRSAG